jgi:hypothetical protein
MYAVRQVSPLTERRLILNINCSIRATISTYTGLYFMSFKIKLGPLLVCNVLFRSLLGYLKICFLTLLLKQCQFPRKHLVFLSSIFVGEKIQKAISAVTE